MTATKKPVVVCTEHRGVFFGFLNGTSKPTDTTVTISDAQMCLAPGTLVLRSDLTWDRIDRVHVGDELLAFDEFNPENGYRRWQVATVLAENRIVRPTYRLTFGDGTTVDASAEHLWLAGKESRRWQTTEGLAIRSGQQSWVVKLAEVTHEEHSKEAGWLAGFFDGEGHVEQVGHGVVVVQKPGPECDYAERLLKERGFSVHRSLSANGDAYLRIRGGTKETLRFVMQTRPERLVRALVARLGSSSITARKPQVVPLVEKEFLGDQEVIALTTDTRTFIAEGLASHNCVYWSADVNGVLGLASSGPSKSCRVSPRVPKMTLQAVTAVIEATDDAVKAWQQRPWA